MQKADLKPSKWFYPFTSGATCDSPHIGKTFDNCLFVVHHTVFAETSAFTHSGFLCAFWLLILFMNASWFEVWINRLTAHTFSYLPLKWLFSTVSIRSLCLLVCFYTMSISRRQAHLYILIFFKQEKEAFITSQLKAKGLTMRDEQGDDMNSENIEQWLCHYWIILTRHESEKLLRKFGVVH